MDQQPERSSAPDGGARDGLAAVAIVVLTVALIVFVVSQIV